MLFGGERVGSWLIDALTFLILFINPGHRFSEVRNRAMEHERLVDHTPPLTTVVSVENQDLLFQEAIKEKLEEEKRYKAIDEKNKVLLTVCALLVAADGTLFSHTSPKSLVLLPLIPIFIAVFLILRYFSVQHMKQVKLNDIDWSEKKDTVDMKVIEQYRECARFLSRRNEFRVGIYRAAYRVMFLGIALLLFVFSWSALATEQNAERPTTIDFNVFKVKDSASSNSNENDAQGPVKTTP